MHLATIIKTDLTELSLAMAHYLSYFAGKSGNTARSKRTALDQFCSFAEDSLNDDTIRLAHVTRSLIEDWIESLLKEGKSPATVAQRLSIIKHFCKMSAQLFQGWQDPSYGITGPRLPIRPPEWITPEERDSIRDYVRSQVAEGFLRARALVVVELGFGSGLRREEISALALCHLDLRRGWLVNFRGKGAAFADMPLTKKAQEAIKAYLPLRAAELAFYWPKHEELSERQQARYPLIVSHWNASPGVPESWRTSPETLNRWLHAFGEAAGVEHMHAHRMRHTFIRQVWLRTRDLEQTMTVARHRDPKQTMRYAVSAKADMEKAIGDD